MAGSLGSWIACRIAGPASWDGCPSGRVDIQVSGWGSWLPVATLGLSATLWDTLSYQV